MPRPPGGRPKVSWLQPLATLYSMLFLKQGLLNRAKCPSLSLPS